MAYVFENLPEPLFSKEGEFPLFAVRRSASDCGEGGTRGWIFGLFGYWVIGVYLGLEIWLLEFDALFSFVPFSAKNSRTRAATSSGFCNSRS